jgi:hypothetical protein
MESFPQRRLVELRPGPAQVTGLVLPTKPLLRAPISGRPCAYYQVIGNNHLWSWHERRCYPPGEVVLWISDGSDRLSIVIPSSRPAPTATAQTLQCSIVGHVVRRTIYAGESPETDRLLGPGGFPFQPDTYLEAEERIIAAGDSLTVSGDVLLELDLGAQAPNFRSPPTRMILRARSLRSVSA